MITLTDRLAYLWPEIALFLTTCIVMVVGLSPRREVRRLCGLVSALGVAMAGVLAVLSTPRGIAVEYQSGQTLLPELVPFAKALIAGVGLLLVPLIAGTVDRRDEARIEAGRAKFDALSSNRAEFYSFFLFSLTGLMLCASADDLIWLFLALELTSLPTYIMVTMSGASALTAGSGRWRTRSQEAGVKYFFLGALGAAIFLYGFALIYGGTGTTNLNDIHAAIQSGGVGTITLAGLLLAVIGVGFKIAAVPMHFYTADVYQGAAAPVSAFLAFVPKTAGFLALILLTATVGWSFGAGKGWEMVVGGGHSLPEPIRVLLWVMAALTMTVGNVLATLQHSVKRILAYSSIAHSGYMLVGIIAGPGPREAPFTYNGLAAVLFYLLCYGVMNMGAFAVVASLERRAAGQSAGEDGVEPDSVDELKGLCQTRPLLGWTMAICCLSLLGLPPLLGFFGKVPLFTAGIAAGEIPLVIVLGLNSAIAAFYYLRLVNAVLLEKPDSASGTLQAVPVPTRRLAGALSAAGVLVLAVVGGPLMSLCRTAASYEFGDVWRADARRSVERAAHRDATAPGGEVMTDDQPADDAAGNGESQTPGSNP